MEITSCVELEKLVKPMMGAKFKRLEVLLHVVLEVVELRRLEGFISRLILFRRLLRVYQSLEHPVFFHHGPFPCFTGRTNSLHNRIPDLLIGPRNAETHAFESVFGDEVDMLGGF